jgi:hypothetical protein
VDAMSIETATQSRQSGRVIPGEARARGLAVGMTRVASAVYLDWLSGPGNLGRLAYLEAKFAAVDWLEDSTSDEYRDWDHDGEPLVLRNGWRITLAPETDSCGSPAFVAVPPDA